MLALTTSVPWLLIFLQARSGLSGTPLIVLLILIILVLALFWWGLTRNRPPAETRETPPPLDDHYDEEGHARVYDQAAADLDLGPADLNVGRVPDPQATAATLASTGVAGATIDDALEDSRAFAGDAAAVDDVEVASATGAALDDDDDLALADDALDIQTAAEPDQPINFGAVDLDATGTAPAGDQVELDMPATHIEPVDVDMTGNVPPVLEDQSEMVPDDPLSDPDGDPIMPASVVSDDLELIEGIGPRIAAVLADHGITTFDQLAGASLAHIQSILDQANLRLANPESWAEQARLAAAGRLDDLRQLQDQLKGGRNI